MRKRKARWKYKTNSEAVPTKITNIQQMLSSGHQAEADAMVTKDNEHGNNCLVGRGDKRSTEQAPASAPSNPYVQDLTTKIKRDMEIELEAKVNKKVQENITWVLKRLGDANPNLKLDIGDFCPALSSEQDDKGTHVTQGGTST